MAILAKMYVVAVHVSGAVRMRVDDAGNSVPVGGDEGKFNSGERVERIELAPVWDGKDGENRAFSTATPAGKLELTITNSDAHGYVEPGELYYVEIRKARK